MVLSGLVPPPESNSTSKDGDTWSIKGLISLACAAGPSVSSSFSKEAGSASRLKRPSSAPAEVVKLPIKNISARAMFLIVRVAPDMPKA